MVRIMETVIRNGLPSVFTFFLTVLDEASGIGNVAGVWVPVLSDTLRHFFVSGFHRLTVIIKLRYITLL